MANTDAKWNEQAFLLDFYKQWLHLNRDKKYNNFVQITGDPSALVNKIYSEGSLNDFSKITTAQASMLVPHIELFKVVYPEKNKESGKKLFGDTSMEINLPFSLNSQAGEFKTGDILASRLARGSAVGLRNLSWEDLGTTPADSGFSFKVNLSLFFQSMDALFREWSTTGLLNGKRETVKTAWADLVTPSGELKNPQKADIGMDADTGKIPYHDKDFLIKLAVGWSVPQDPGKAVFSPKDKRILEAIKRQRISYILSLNDHSINLNADGTVELDLTYLARIEGRMLNSANADLLYIEDGSPLVKVVDVIKRTVEQIKKDERKAQAEGDRERKDLEDKKLNAGPIYTGAGFGRPDVNPFDTLIKKSENKTKNNLESLSVRKKVQEKLLREAKYEQKAQSYRRIMKQIEESARIYQIAVTPKMVEAWVASMDRATDKKTVEERNEEILKKRGNSKNVVNKGLSGQNINERKGKFDNMELNKEFIEAAAIDGDDGQKKREDALNKYFQAKKADDTPEDGETYVSFFFFGDLLEAAINVVLEGKQGRYNLLGDGNKRKIDKSDFDFLLGPIEMFEYFEGDRVEVTSVPLCDIPISTKLFGMWFAKNIIKPMRETLTLKQFLRMVAAELIQGMLSPPIYGPIGAKQKTKMSFNTFSLPTSKKNPFRTGARDRNRIDIDKITYPDFYNVFRNTAKTRDYFMMYFAGPISNRLTGDFVTDSKMGIPHFEIAQDRGIVKNINFSKVDIPGFREANIEKNEKASKRNLLYSNKYSAQVNTLGCPVFKPGMLTNINPRGFGIGKKSKYAQLGFGGYYTITKVSNNISNGSYETSLEMHYESPSPPINPTSYKISYQKSEDLREMSDPSLGRETRQVQNAIISVVKNVAEVVGKVTEPLTKPYKDKSLIEAAIIAKQPLDEGGDGG
tara:strand:- start:4782 stop:7526 length:2745 start_codon:yes stop_codon:yes gene_type:complete